MSKVVYYSLAGAMATLIALSLIKKKPNSTIFTSSRALPSPKKYVSVEGDRPTAIAARFGTNIGALMQANNKVVLAGKGRVLNLPPNVADLGKRPQAMGNVA